MRSVSFCPNVFKRFLACIGVSQSLYVRPHVQTALHPPNNKINKKKSLSRHFMTKSRNVKSQLRLGGLKEWYWTTLIANDISMGGFIVWINWDDDLINCYGLVANVIYMEVFDVNKLGRQFNKLLWSGRLCHMNGDLFVWINLDDNLINCYDLVAYNFLCE